MAGAASLPWSRAWWRCSPLRARTASRAGWRTRGALLPPWPSWTAPAPTGESSTTVDRPASGRLARDPRAALDEFAATGFIELDDRTGVLEVVGRDRTRARAEYRLGDATRAVLLVAADGGWWVDAVARCSELDTTTSS